MFATLKLDRNTFELPKGFKASFMLVPDDGQGYDLPFLH